jgi:glutaredoxin 3
MAIKVEIYTRSNCAFCRRAKELLRIKGVDFVEHDITNDLLLAAEMRLRSQRPDVPEIFVNDVLVGGCNELFDLDERGQLDGMLGLDLPYGPIFQPA